MKLISGILMIFYSLVIFYLVGDYLFGFKYISIFLVNVLDFLFNLEQGLFLAITIFLGPLVVVLAIILGIAILISSVYSFYFGFIMIRDDIIKKIILYKETGSFIDKEKIVEKEEIIKIQDGNPYFIIIIIAIFIRIIAYNIGTSI